MVEGLRALITQSTFANIGGSEVQAFELAQYLQSQKCTVTLYAWSAGWPMRDLIQKAGIDLVVAQDSRAQELLASEFDFVWVQHEVMPASLLRSFADDEVSPVVVFSHMSPYKEVHIERPYTYDLENAVADLVVCNSRGTQDSLRDLLPENDRIALYPNPVPLEFTNARSRTSWKLHRILMVSNHPPEELENAIRILRTQGYVVDTLSDALGGDSPAITSADKLAEYDCVITIGKTVQYCLVQGVPVFVYDRFGGPGYLNENNYEIAKYYNFSGRNHDDSFSLGEAMRNANVNRLSSEDIASLLISGYDEAVEFQMQNREAFTGDYSIAPVFDVIFDKASKRLHSKELGCAYLEYVIATQQMVSDYVSAHQRMVDARRAFYSQDILLYSCNDASKNFTQRVVTLYGSGLRPTNAVEYEAHNVRAVRVDFGELPCKIPDISVISHANSDEDLIPCKYSTNAVLIQDGEYVFPYGDPQISVETESGEGLLPSFTLKATVKPLSQQNASELGMRHLNDLAKQVQDLKTELESIKNSRWWKLRGRIIKDK